MVPFNTVEVVCSIDFDNCYGMRLVDIVEVHMYFDN